MHKGAFGAQHCKGEQCSLSAKPLGHGFAATAPLSGEPWACALHRVHNGPSVLGTEGLSAGAVRAAGSAFVAAAAFAEQQADAPEAGEADEGVDDAGDDGGLAAEDPGDEVKFENADQAPIQGADDGKNQCDGIHSLCNLQFFYDAPSISNSEGIIRRRGARGEFLLSEPRFAAKNLLALTKYFAKSTLQRREFGVYWNWP